MSQITSPSRHNSTHASLALFLRVAVVSLVLVSTASASGDEIPYDRDFDPDDAPSMVGAVEAGQVSISKVPERNEVGFAEAAPDTRRWPDACDGPCDAEEPSSEVMALQ